LRIVMAETGVDQETALAALQASGWAIKEALNQLK